jgi:hypothetical protein
MGVARRVIPLCLVLWAGFVGAAEPVNYKRALADVEIDWSQGLITAQAGASADIRMPGPNAARPGAQRRARAAAEEKLRAACKTIGQGRSLDDKGAIALATLSRIEYQSDGGVVLWLSIRFADLIAAKPTPIAFKIASMPFELSPSVEASGRQAQVGLATYRPFATCPKDAIPVRRNAKGHLELPASQAKVVESLADSAVVIYLEKAQP